MTKQEWELKRSIPLAATTKGQIPRASNRLLVGCSALGLAVLCLALPGTEPNSHAAAAASRANALRSAQRQSAPKKSAPSKRAESERSTTDAGNFEECTARSYRFADSTDEVAEESDLPTPAQSPSSEDAQVPQVPDVSQVASEPRENPAASVKPAPDKPRSGPTPAAAPVARSGNDKDTATRIAPTKGAPRTEGELIASFVQFTPSKSPKESKAPADSAARVRPVLVQRAQPNDAARALIVSDSDETQLPSPGSAEARLSDDEAEPAAPGAPTELPEEIQAEFKSIGSLGTRIQAKDGQFPTDFAVDRFKREGELYHALGYRRPWQPSNYSWVAPGLCHYPLYFEEINLERHGYNVGVLQPAASAISFYGRLAMLPYLMAIDRPLECQYTLGHYRPGSYAPFHLHHPPVRARGLVAEAATVAALFLIFP